MGSGTPRPACESALPYTAGVPEGLFPTDARTDAGVYLAVALERGIAGGPLTYAPPVGCTEPPGAMLGRACLAPLGRSGERRPTRGIVVKVGGRELLEGLSPARVKPLAALGRARLTPALLKLGAWISDYYACPLGMTYAAMLPAAVKKGVGRKVRQALRPSGAQPVQRLPPATAAAWEALSRVPEDRWPVPERELVSLLGLRNAGPIRRLASMGLLESVSLSEVLPRGGADAAGLGPAMPGVSQADRAPNLTDAQRAVVEGVGLERFAVHLLFGVTGSGKTEVYLRLLERVLAAGRQGIVLVPEIALTPQLAQRFVDRFGPALGERAVVVLHSGQSAGQRHAAWDALASGQAKVVVGPRSAVFAPLGRVGLIVVDEEHAGDYKQDQAPRYHGRDVAIKRAQIEGCPVLLGSATPSLESWRNAQQGRYTLWRMPDRVPGSAGLPTVRVVDLAQERKAALQAGRRMELLGPTLMEGLTRTLDQGGQAVLLLNRRGFARVVACPDAACGWTLQCQACASAMVFHRKGVLGREGLVRCHHCLAEQLRPRVCPVCGRGLILLGRGTQRLEDELVACLGLAPDELARMDADTMQRPADYQRVLAGMAQGTIRVLLGTQMIAKGLDFPNVRLVGVVDADTALGIADWRCHERTFQLVSQVAGRAGRGSQAGLVIVQTHSPDLPAIRAAAEHDFERFAGQELAVRRRASLPPFTRAAWIVSRDRDYEKAFARAQRIGELLGEAFAGRARIEGPAPAPLERAHEAYRVGVEVYAPTAGVLHQGLSRLRREHGLVSDAHVAIDVDPVSIW
ncbi:MAG: primosomal protein N' [Phycisphaerales bacterium]|nr:MAG: primosomal protein N' [Phycisphaerales bacterium]